MINSLLAMHNIKYIISVDDCYFAPKEDEMKSKIYSEMCESFDPFREYLVSTGRSSDLNEVEALLSLGADVTVLITNLLSEISEKDVKKLFEIANEKDPYLTEQAGILGFLESLKSKGYINQYLTLSSTVEASALDCDKAGMADGSILWLLDRNFERVGESPEAGIQLAQTIAERQSAQNNYVYILSAVEPDSDVNEDEIEAEFDGILSATCNAKISSFVYYINKQRILSNNEKKIAKSLAQGFKRKVCYEIFQAYRDSLHVSSEAVSEIIFGIKQKTLNYLFSQKIDPKGESHTAFVARLIHLFQTDEYNKALASKHKMIAEKVSYYKDLCEKVTDGGGEAIEMTPILKSFREIELYNKHINFQHQEISTGDIFKINDSYFLLISQACDTYLRKEGLRKLDHASLLKIEDGGVSDNSYKLSCFADFNKPKVMYQKLLSIPFDVLDLCVLNDDGQARIELAYVCTDKKHDCIGYTKNYMSRLQTVRNHIKNIYKHQINLEKFLSNELDVTNEDAKIAYEFLLSEAPFIKKYKTLDDKFFYPVQRICRLDELTTIDIIKEYGVVLSRIGHPFDFL